MKGGGGGGGGGNYDHHHHHHHHQIHGYNKSAKLPPPPSSSPIALPRFMVYLLLLISFVYLLYSLSLFLTPSRDCPQTTAITTTSKNAAANLNATTSRFSIPVVPTPIANLTAARSRSRSLSLPLVPAPSYPPTSLSHIVFGIAASASLWDKRRDYLKIWWRPRQMRGFVWLDKPVAGNQDERESQGEGDGLPKIMISSDTSKFRYTHRKGHRSAIRISRIVSETFRLDLPDVHWFVMGDDDTVFLPDNLVAALSKFDHRQHYYIGAPSESHLQNIYFSYTMAYGGGGFAISRPLAAAVARMQDACLQRYPALYGSDDRIQACMAELGVPLTRHSGFHQYDVYGDLLGLLAAHPVAPLVSLHHLDVVEPIFPKMARSEAVKKLFDGPIRLDSAGVMQQSICYDRERGWTVSVSWGFVVEVVRGVVSPREMEVPARTFVNWYRKADYRAYAFNTRPIARSPCEKPHVFYMEGAEFDAEMGTTVTRYLRFKERHPVCKWKVVDPAVHVDEVLVYKKPDPNIWNRAPRRNCCRVMPSTEGQKKMGVEIGLCKEEEVIMA